MKHLDGIIPILATPYDDHGNVAGDALRRQIDHFVGQGLLTCGIGFGSDILRLTEAERDRMVATVTGHANGSIRLMVSCGANSVQAALERASATAQAGADLLMVTPPGGLGQPDPEAIFDYYAAISEHVGLPIVAQDAPGMGGVQMSVALLGRLGRELPGVVALKIESIPSAPKISAIVGELAGAASVLGGAGGLDFYHELERGASGTVPGAGMPAVFRRVFDLHRAGERDEARRLFNSYLPLLCLSNRSYDTFLFVQLELLRRQGVVLAALSRTPRESPDQRLGSELDQLLNDLHWP